MVANGIPNMTIKLKKKLGSILDRFSKISKFATKSMFYLFVFFGTFREKARGFLVRFFKLQDAENFSRLTKMRNYFLFRL